VDALNAHHVGAVAAGNFGADLAAVDAVKVFPGEAEIGTKCSVLQRVTDRIVLIAGHGAQPAGQLRVPERLQALEIAPAIRVGFAALAQAGTTRGRVRARSAGPAAGVRP